MFTYETFIKAHQRMSQERFKSRYPHPFLLLMMDDPFEPNSDGFRTANLVDPLGVKGNQEGKKCFIAPVVPKGITQRAFDMVSIGRTSSNDIVLSQPEISKCHCYFRCRKDGGVSLVDSWSTNGTCINGEPLEPNVPVIVEGCEEIVFGGRVTGIFLQPEMLFSLLNGETPHSTLLPMG